ncbi:hypothetical protein H480_00220 [Amycolatopsis vancoresmycina DSM 44592]|uniref:Uncharacterized protein n=1 Tax=Amycolatopsis vancoresmycina DSM 44592 TaxID=1292037 RepID=R1GHD1_9PSEU|nr:hypothetical protein H480_00220 [Amycolatopsis vancoresmycina DSM 44592]
MLVVALGLVEPLPRLRHDAASSYHQLGMAAHELRRLDEAERHYEHAIDLKLELAASCRSSNSSFRSMACS